MTCIIYHNIVVTRRKTIHDVESTMVRSLNRATWCVNFPGLFGQLHIPGFASCSGVCVISRPALAPNKERLEGACFFCTNQFVSNMFEGKRSWVAGGNGLSCNIFKAQHAATCCKALNNSQQISVNPDTQLHAFGNAASRCQGKTWLFQAHGQCETWHRWVMADCVGSCLLGCEWKWIPPNGHWNGENHWNLECPIFRQTRFFMISNYCELDIGCRMP